MVEAEHGLESPFLSGAPDFDGYEVVNELGRGGQGIVYRARQKSLNRLVALKVIGLGTWATESHLRRFRREAEAAASLRHPSLVAIHEIGESRGCCYFSMDLIEGSSLDQLVRRTRSRPAGRRIDRKSGPGHSSCS